MPRLTDIAAEKVKAAIENLQVPQVVKDSIAWEVVPAIGADMFKFMLAMCVPIPDTDDQALLLKPPYFDPFDDQAVINQLVRVRLDEVQQDADRIHAESNGHKTSPGGLVLP